jgi:hypothetical protein
MILVMMTLLAGASPGGALAQTTRESEVVVQRMLANDALDSRGRRALKVSVTYSLVNQADQSVIDADDVETSSLFMPATAQEIPATPDRPVSTDNWSIVLLTDLSRPSDNTDFNNLMSARAMLAERLESGPAANYAWYEFNKDILQRPAYVNFQPIKNENEKGLVADLKKRAATSEKSSCLNRALLEAVRKVKGVSGRKAVLVLTHQTDTCRSQSSESEVIAEANAAGDASQRVQIFAIGLGNAPLREALKRLTTATGGYAIANDTVQELSPAIQQLMLLIKNQREAIFITYPDAGPQQAELRVLLKTNTLKTAPVTFDSPAAYEAPPAVAFSNALPSPEGMRITLRGINPKGYKSLIVELTDRATGLPKRREIVGFGEDFQDDLYTLLLNRDQEVKEGGNYLLQIFLVAPDGSKESLFGDRPFEFTYVLEQPQIAFSGEPVAASPRAPVFVLTVTSSAQTMVDAWLQPAGQQGDQSPVAFQKNVTLRKDDAHRIEFAAADLPAGNYVGAVQLIVADSKPIFSSVMVYNKGDLFTTIRAYAEDQPWLIAVLLAIGSLTIVLILWTIWFAKSRSVGAPKYAGDELDRHYREPAMTRLPPIGGSTTGSSDMWPAAKDSSKTKLGESQPFGVSSTNVAATQSSAPPASVVALQPAGLVFRGQVKSTPFVIGREAPCHGILNVDSSSGVSRKHATLIYQNGAWHVRDENTANGTRVNGTRILPNTLVPLGATARIMLGPKVEIEFRATAQSR